MKPKILNEVDDDDDDDCNFLCSQQKCSFHEMNFLPKIKLELKSFLHSSFFVLFRNSIFQSKQKLKVRGLCIIFLSLLDKLMTRKAGPILGKGKDSFWSLFLKMGHPRPHF